MWEDQGTKEKREVRRRVKNRSKYKDEGTSWGNDNEATEKTDARPFLQGATRPFGGSPPAPAGTSHFCVPTNQVHERQQAKG